MRPIHSGDHALGTFEVGACIDDHPDVAEVGIVTEVLDRNAFRLLVPPSRHVLQVGLGCHVPARSLEHLEGEHLDGLSDWECPRMDVRDQEVYSVVVIDGPIDESLIQEWAVSRDSNDQVDIRIFCSCDYPAHDVVQFTSERANACGISHRFDGVIGTLHGGRDDDRHLVLGAEEPLEEIGQQRLPVDDLHHLAGQPRRGVASLNDDTCVHFARPSVRAALHGVSGASDNLPQPMTADPHITKAIPFGRPMIGDREQRAVLDVLSGDILVHGPKAAAFEDAFAGFTGAPAATSVSSCTAGMHLAYFDLGLGPGDEVIVPAETHVATAHAVELTGATCVFVDAEARSGNIDVDAVESAITDRTRAITVVHFLGEPADMDAIGTLASKRDLFVLEDCALAVGSRVNGKHVGLFGDAGVFSFYPVKHMTTAEGGMVISNDESRIGRLARKRAFGVDRTVQERSVPGVYDVTMLGFNYRMNELSAALGLVQLERVPDFLSQRRRNFTVLRDALSELSEVTVLHASDGPERVSSHYCLSAVLDSRLSSKRFELVDALRARGIGTSVYYPKPVPEMRYYQERYQLAEGAFPNASWISGSSVALPVGPHLDEDDMRHIGDTFKTVLGELI